MRIAGYFCALAAVFLLDACTKDLSCYRDMIIGTWVAQTFDGQVPATKLRSVHTFDRQGVERIIRIRERGDGSCVIDSVTPFYEVYCKTLTTTGDYTLEEYEIITFTDSMLRLRVISGQGGEEAAAPEYGEVTYGKVDRENAHAARIRDFWEMTHCSDPSVEPFSIDFKDNSVYHFFWGHAGEQEEKADEAGTYHVFGSFLMTSSFNNPVLGTAGLQDAACWDIGFSEEEEGKATMSWRAVAYEHDQRVEKTFTFTAIVREEE